MTKTESPKISSIVVRGANWIGDAIMTIPALKELSRIFPDARIVLHTRSWAEGVFRDADFIDGILAIDDKGSKLKQSFSESDSLQQLKFDLAVLMPNSFQSAFTTAISKIPRRIGYNKDLRGLLLSDPVPVPDWKNSRHEVFYYLNLVSEVERRFLGTDSVKAAEPDIRLPISDERQTSARNLIAQSGGKSSQRSIAIGAGSTNSLAKRWPASRFAQLADLMCSEFSANILLVGSPDERSVAEEIEQECTSPIINLVGKTDLATAAAVLSVCDLLVSNDMGLAHLAAAVETSAATIFGPTNPETTRPFSSNAVVIRREDVDCSPCMLRDCPIDHRCMTRVTVEHVFEVCKELLENQND